MAELDLYGIRLLVKQFLGAVLDIEVDQSGSDNVMSSDRGTVIGRDPSRYRALIGGALLC